MLNDVIVSKEINIAALVTEIVKFLTIAVNQITYLFNHLICFTASLQSTGSQSVERRYQCFCRDIIYFYKKFDFSNKSEILSPRYETASSNIEQCITFCLCSQS